MSKRTKNFKLSVSERRVRRFSDDFKRKRVKELEESRCTIAEIVRAYEVSDTSVRRWITKFSTKNKPVRTIVESKSDTSKIVELQKRIAQLERKVGQMTVERDFKDKLIELTEKKYGIEIKKKKSK